MVACQWLNVMGPQQRHENGAGSFHKTRFLDDLLELQQANVPAWHH
jgi:hypothetical protein